MVHGMHIKWWKMENDLHLTGTVNDSRIGANTPSFDSMTVLYMFPLKNKQGYVITMQERRFSTNAHFFLLSGHR